jgi:phytoene dehydrogenase-like protein
VPVIRASQGDFDAIVVGSGVGGLTAAAALAIHGRRVLVLEQHSQLGGLTQTFTRGAYAFATGLHYLTGLGDEPGPDRQFRDMLDRLTGGRLQFASIGSPYDIVRLPDFEFPIEAPLEAFRERLKATFPAEARAVDAYFAACERARRAAYAAFRDKALPEPAGAVMRFLDGPRVRRAFGVTNAGALRGIRDARLAAVLAARWLDYGLPPDKAPLALHAMVMGAYGPGAHYPVGGPSRLAAALADTIRGARGELRTGAAVTGILVSGGRAAGVRLANGDSIAAPVIVSGMGAHNTAAAMPEGVAREWTRSLVSVPSTTAHVGLYLGFRGDIRERGATPANVWLYESADVGRLWERPLDDDAPGIFVSFPSLKDPAHPDPAHHTGEVLATCAWEPFAAWADSSPGHRPEEYEATKAWIGERLLGQFRRHFPRLAPLIDFHEVSTPLSQAAFVGADRGAMYGAEMSAERMTGLAFRPRTPVPGLLLAGQDAVSLGVPGAFMGGWMAAACVEPRLWMEMGRRP